MNNGFKGQPQQIPLARDNSTTTSFEQHLGVLNKNGKIYPNALKLEVVDGLVWSTVPKIPKRFFLSLIKNYHFADINLFWKDIEKNAARSRKSWQQKILKMLDNILKECQTAWIKTKTKRNHAFRYFSLATTAIDGTQKLAWWSCVTLMLPIITSPFTPMHEPQK